jgi:hypothetical protein
MLIVSFPDVEEGRLVFTGESVSSDHKFIAARSESGRPVTTVDTRMAFQERLVSYLN